jgi:hypothetical protein
MKRLIILAILLLVVVEIGIIFSVRAGDANERTLPRLPHSALKSPVLPPITVQEVSGILPENSQVEQAKVGVPAALPAPTHDTPPIVTQAGTGEAADSLDIDRSWIYRYLESVERDRQHRRMVWRIDTYLLQRGSPMQGCGEYYVRNAERTGIPACLPVGIAAAESTDGMQCFAPHNPFGMIGFRSGWSSWEEGITANFDYLVRYFGCPQDMFSCGGYCEGDTTMQTVDQVQRYIEGIDANWIN